MTANYSDAQAPIELPGTTPDAKSVHCFVVPYEQQPPSGKHSKFHELQSFGSAVWGSEPHSVTDQKAVEISMQWPQ